MWYISEVFYWRVVAQPSLFGVKVFHMISTSSQFYSWTNGNVEVNVDRLKGLNSKKNKHIERSLYIKLLSDASKFSLVRALDMSTTSACDITTKSKVQPWIA
jgi:hypothetical protein